MCYKVYRRDIGYLEVMLKKVLSLIICIFWGVNISFAVQEVQLDNNQTQKLNLTKPDKVISGSLVLNDKESVQNLVDVQQKDELNDIETLWKATIENNELIKFTMKKLNTPESQRRLHSSIMAKSLSALVYGASFVPSFMGGNPLMQSASFTTGRLANNFINKNNIQQAPPLSDTELIELAGTIESLQDVIISTYYSYKGALTMLKDTRAKMILYNRNYANAIRKNNQLEIIISSSLYDDLKMQEFKQEETAKMYYLELERLAGKDAVDKLNMSQYAMKNQLVNPEGLKKQ